MAGIIGIKTNSRVGRKLFYGLNSLQHRGQEGCGIAVYDGEDIVRERGNGLAIDFLKEDIINNIGRTIMDFS